MKNYPQIISTQRIREITDQFSKMGEIMVVGDLGVDKYTSGEVRRISPEAPVPVLEVSREWTKLGLAANISDNLKTLGIRSLLCGIVGKDERASLLENLLEERDLSTWGLVRDDSRPTIYKERVTTDTQQICRIDYEMTQPLSTQMSERLSERVGEFIGNYQGVILEDYAKGTLSEEVCQYIISESRKQNKIVTVDPGVSTPAHFYRGAHLLKPNLKEARLICQALGQSCQAVEEMAKTLVEQLQLDMVVITLGGEGMAMLEKGKEVKIIPTAANEVFDVSGAGDTAIALLTASLMAGASLEEAAWIGNCGAGVVVAKQGTATVTLDELLEFHQALLKDFKV